MWQGIYAMAECHIDDKMADNFHNINFMYGLRQPTSTLS